MLEKSKGAAENQPRPWLIACAPVAWSVHREEADHAVTDQIVRRVYEVTAEIRRTNTGRRIGRDKQSGPRGRVAQPRDRVRVRERYVGRCSIRDRRDREAAVIAERARGVLDVTVEQFSNRYDLPHGEPVR